MAGISLVTINFYSGPTLLPGCSRSMPRMRRSTGKLASSWLSKSQKTLPALRSVKDQQVVSVYRQSIVLIAPKVDLSLRYIIKLCQAFVVFTTFDDLFLLWLESTSNRPLNKVILFILTRPLLKRRAANCAPTTAFESGK